MISRTNRIITAIALCLLAVSFAGAEEQPLSTIIAGMAKGVSNIQTLRANGVWQMEFDMEGMKQKTEMEVSIVYERPRRLYVKTQQSMIVCDGSNAYVRMPMGGKYYQFPMDSDLSQLVEGRLKPYLFGVMPDMKALLSADPAAALQESTQDAKIEVLPEETLEDRACWVVNYSGGEGSGPMGKFTLKAWVDKESGLIRRIESVPPTPDEAKAGEEDSEEARLTKMMKNMKYSFRVADLVVNGPVSDADFVFTPQPGDRKVETEVGLTGSASSRSGGFGRFELSGKQAPDFSVKLLDGNTFQLSAHTGSVVLIDFWATWCGPCVRALPEMRALHELYGTNGLVVVGVSRDKEDSEDKVRKMVEEKGLAYPVGIDTQEIGEAYKVRGIPCLVLVDQKGVVQGRKVGFGAGGLEALKKDIETVLAGKSLEGAQPMTDAELKELEAEARERETMRGRTSLDTNVFRVRWERSAPEDKTQSYEMAPLTVKIPARVLAAADGDNLVAINTADGSTNCVIPLPPEARAVNERKQKPTLWYLRTPDGGAAVAVKTRYEVSDRDGHESYSGRGVELVGVGLDGSVIWTNDFGRERQVRSVDVVPASDKEDVLLVSSWNRMVLVNAAGQILMTQGLEYRNRIELFQDADGALKAFVQGRKTGLYDVVIPASAPASE